MTAIATGAVMRVTGAIEYKYEYIILLFVCFSVFFSFLGGGGTFYVLFSLFFLVMYIDT